VEETRQGWRMGARWLCCLANLNSLIGGQSCSPVMRMFASIHFLPPPTSCLHPLPASTHFLPPSTLVWPLRARAVSRFVTVNAGHAGHRTCVCRLILLMMIGVCERSFYIYVGRRVDASPKAGYACATSSAFDSNASFHIDWQREGDLDLL
jgi:hypothetical protein